MPKVSKIKMEDFWIFSAKSSNLEMSKVWTWGSILGCTNGPKKDFCQPCLDVICRAWHCAAWNAEQCHCVKSPKKLEEMVGNPQPTLKGVPSVESRFSMLELSCFSSLVSTCLFVGSILGRTVFNKVSHTSKVYVLLFEQQCQENRRNKCEEIRAHCCVCCALFSLNCFNSFRFSDRQSQTSVAMKEQLFK